jgi:FHS family glucose/mannose:H+ symporter-like MFS transporter
MGVGYTSSALGILALGVLPWPGPIVASALNGTGLGLVIPLTNLLVARTAGRAPSLDPLARPMSSSRGLTILNFAWGAGSVIWPAAIAMHARMGRVGLFEPSAFVAIGLVGSALGVNHLRGESRPPAATLSRRGGWAVSPDILGALAVYGVFQLLYVGTENAIAGWVGEHVRRIEPETRLWIAAPTTFWASLMIGRLIGPLVLRVVSDTVAMTTCLGLILVASTAIVAFGRVDVIFVAIAIAGLGCSLVFPVLIAATTEDLDRRAPALVGVAFACGGVGGALIPWLVGFTASTSGSLTTGLVVPLATSAVMIALLPLWIRGLRGVPGVRS